MFHVAGSATFGRWCGRASRQAAASFSSTTTTTRYLLSSSGIPKYRQDGHVRRLEDGRAYNVVKVMYQPAELEALLRQLGWSAEMHATRWFLFGSARPS
jgi:hypothetical protein